MKTAGGGQPSARDVESAGRGTGIVRLSIFGGVVKIGVRQKLIMLIFSGLFLTMGLIGAYRYYDNKRSIMHDARIDAEHTCGLLAELAAPYLLTSDYVGLHSLADKFMRTPNAQELTISDGGGRQLLHVERPALNEQRIIIGPLAISSEPVKLGELRLAVYPADIDARLRSYAVSALVEHLFIFVILAGIIFISVSRSIIAPVRGLGDALKGMIDRKDFTRRVETSGGDEIGSLGRGVNYLIERLEQIVHEMGAIASKISDLSPAISADAHEIRRSAELETEAIASVSSSVGEMSSSIQSMSEGAESLSHSADEVSSAILEMNASNQEVARHTGELTSVVEDVTTSVLEMIASIREVAGHVETLSTAADETSTSAVQIEASVREVEQAAKESARLSQQVSLEARDIGVRSIHETVVAIDTIKDAVGRYSGLVTQLGKRSEEIGKILGVIVDVAERTNLLALNASILAAQAGEHGRGFAVVAEEIKALADRTAGSAQDISRLIIAVQKEARDAVSAIAESLTAVDEGVRRARDADAALQKILTSSGSSAETAVMIEHAMAEQATGIRHVSESITNVRQLMSQILSATQAQSKGTEMILNAAEGMRDIARHVRSAMTEQGRGGKQIVTASENVAARAGQIALGTKEQRQASAQILESMERIQDLPRRNMKRMEGMTTSLKALGEQAELLKQEISTMTFGTGPRDAGTRTLRMGVIPLEAPAEMYRRFTPLAEYLTRVLGRHLELLISIDFELTLKNLEDGTTDLAFLTPTTYIEAKRKYGALVVVQALRKGVPYTHSAIVVRKGSGISRLEELRGRTFAFGSPKSNSSYLIPRHLLAGAGIKLSDLKEHAFLGHHDDVARAVLAGSFDAGGLMESTAKKFEGQGLSVIATSPEIPEFNISASRDLDPELIPRIKQALLALDRNNPEHANVLSLIDQDYTGFAEAADSDYDGIRKIMETG